MNQTDWTTAQTFALYIAALLVLGVLDGLWLGWLAKDLYRREMGDLMAASPRIVPAAIFYLAYPLAVVYFGLLPLSAGGANSADAATIATAFFRCAAIGLLAYGTYDLTNMSVIRGFSVKLSIIDMAWGTFVSGVSGAAALAAARWWAQRG